jgi:predicted metal-binding membrane protein
MESMPMPGAESMSGMWIPMCGQSWASLAASFLGMWMLMMAVMMLPSAASMLWRYRQSVSAAGGLPSALLTACVGAGYFMVWALVGAAIFPLGAAIATLTMRYLPLTRAVPVASALLVSAAGALQLTRWKAQHLAVCRSSCCRPSGRRGASLPDVLAGFRHGLRLGLHCSQCCAGLTAVLLLTGLMDVPVMAAVTAGITLERLLPGGERVARMIGIAVTAAGLLLSARAVGLG